ncbi:helix-hairpin-helix domain-containing protein [Clostridium sp. MT-14]|jgi:competence protein ComEA|uniref:Helix-hairpin-helix domain-containing protein n=1 Tax=Clostridium aromativorans TaxID=2836848 RepID=A0ABS8N331_9CLOT|nr:MULTISPECIES: helix-hairpin-helix domain-containing protein [Clostridium]KAA8673329.1 DNA-binding protein [Clostridium sp. HV4-5-A1G]MCC9294165.1 helix-hairpin-helix domain-containing protein [Clostridium aromativorans]CAB1240138.1 ComE operon protein 1 [Clostridiaceae bacterium BL-3]
MKNKKKIIGSVVILAVFFVFLIVGYINSRPVKIDENSRDIFEEGATSKDSNETGDDNYSKEITVYINGQVKNPGVYKLKDNSRVESLVKAAGGFTDKADSCRLNLAKKLKDEDYIYVDSKIGNTSGGPNSSALSESQIGSDGKININRASKEELKTIPGVGDITAQKIMDYREQNGDFASVEDLKKIDRIGDKTLDKMRDKIDVR